MFGLNPSYLSCVDTHNGRESEEQALGHKSPPSVTFPSHNPLGEDSGHTPALSPQMNI